jgi:hypothetical protein
MSDNTSDPDRIEHDLDRTRARLDNRLSELQDRLSPGQVVDDLMNYFRGSEGADFGRNLLDSVRANPVPAALTGIGLAWLMASNPHPQGGAMGASPVGSRGRVRVSSGPGGIGIPTTYDVLTTRVRSAEQGVVRQQGEAEHAYSDRLNAARGQALGIARQAQETAEGFAQRVQDALSAAASAASQGLSSAAGAVSQGASSATQAVVQGAHDLRDSAGDALGHAGDAVQHVSQHASDQFAQGASAAKRAGGSLVSALTESPVLLGVIGLAAGALLGALVPQSEEEEAALGAYAGQARGAARDLAQEAVDRGGHVVEAVLKAGRESAGQHGLSGAMSLEGIVEAAKSGDLAGNAAQVAQDVLKAADEAVRKEGLGEGQGNSPSA